MTRRISVTLVVITLLLWACSVARCNSDSIASSQLVDKGVVRNVLENGLRILVKPEPGSGLVAVTVMIRAGASEETIHNAGIGNFVAQLLLASTRQSSATDVASVAEEVGGNLEAQWGPDCTQLRAVTTASMFAKTTSLLAECVSEANFESEWVEKVRAQLIKQADDGLDDPFEIAYAKMRTMVYADNGYKRSPVGLERTVKVAQPEDLRRFYAAYYVPNNMVISIVGDVIPEQAFSRINMLFGPLASKPLPKRLPIPDEELGMSRSYVAEVDGNLAYMLVGWLSPGTNSKEYSAMAVASNALGGGKGSSMFQKIRQEMGMGYEVGVLYPRMRNQSHLVAYVATDPFKFDSSMGSVSLVTNDIKSALIKLTDKLKQQPLSDRELRRAKGFTIGNYARSLQHLADRAEMLAWMECVGSGYDMYDRFSDMIEKVTAQDVQRAANKYLGKYALVVLLPKTKSAPSQPEKGQ